MREIPGPEDEETVGGTDEDVVTEQREAQTAEAPCGDVEEEGPAFLVVCPMEQDPLPWPEPEVGDRGVRRWLGDGRAPAGADGPHVHVLLDAAGGEDAVGDELDEVRLKRRPFARRFSLLQPPSSSFMAAPPMQAYSTNTASPMLRVWLRWRWKTQMTALKGLDLRI